MKTEWNRAAKPAHTKACIIGFRGMDSMPICAQTKASSNPPAVCARARHRPTCFVTTGTIQGVMRHLSLLSKLRHGPSPQLQVGSMSKIRASLRPLDGVGLASRGHRGRRHEFPGCLIQCFKNLSCRSDGLIHFSIGSALVTLTC